MPSLTANMTEKQKHIRVTVDDCKRNFLFTTYGSKQLAALAAAEFESYAKTVLDEFDSMGRQPQKRKTMLDTHGIGNGFNKKAIRVQRAALCYALSGGDSMVVEKEICDHVWKKVPQRRGVAKDIGSILASYITISGGVHWCEPAVEAIVQVATPGS